MVAIKIGDVFEVNTSKGKAYIHYVCNDKEIGELIRVLPGLFTEDLINLEELVSLKERYCVYFPLSFGYKKGLIKRVDNFSIEKYEKPQFMRSEHNIRGEFLGWHIVSTDSWERKLVKELTEEQKKYSPWGVWNDTLLIERLENDWKLESW